MGIFYDIVMKQGCYDEVVNNLTKSSKKSEDRSESKK